MSNDSEKWYTSSRVVYAINGLVSVFTSVEKYFRALAEKTELETAIMEAQTRPLEEASQEPKGMMRHPFGFCPVCGAPHKDRKRDGTNVCPKGHRSQTTFTQAERDKKFVAIDKTPQDCEEGE